MTYFLTENATHLRRMFIHRQASVGSLQSFVFADGERGLRLTEDVRRQPVCILGSVTGDPSSLFDILATYRALRDNRSQTPKLILPYMGYARQDRAASPGETALGVMVAELLRNLNTMHLVVLDVHDSVVFDALGPSAEHISACSLFATELQKGGLVDMVVAPDAGARDRAKQLATALGESVETAWIEKTRPKPNVAQAKTLHGSVKGKHIVIFDDIIDTGGTMIEAVRLVSKEGALSIRLAATHGLFSKESDERLARLPIKEVLVTNSLPQSRRSAIRVLDITPLLLHA